MKFKKKPVEIEAEQYTAYGQLVRGMCNSVSCYTAGNTEPHVHTIHDGQIVLLAVGDWVIPEPDGEHFYPVKPDIFAATYEPLAAFTPAEPPHHITDTSKMVDVYVNQPPVAPAEPQTPPVPSVAPQTTKALAGLLPRWLVAIDWAEYRHQKRLLAGIVEQAGTTSHEQREACSGLLSLLDAVQDWGDDHGLDTYTVQSNAYLEPDIDPPAAPVPSSARPDSQTVEQAKARVLCDHRGSLALDNFKRRCEQCGFEFTPSYSPTVREQAADALILAVRQEQADARPARTLADYRPQHDVQCDSNLCAHRVAGVKVCDDVLHNHIHGPWRGHGFIPQPCTCGLDALLSGGAPHGR